jgi:hypothetical protein
MRTWLLVVAACSPILVAPTNYQTGCPRPPTISVQPPDRPVAAQPSNPSLGVSLRIMRGLDVVLRVSRGCGLFAVADV